METIVKKPRLTKEQSEKNKKIAEEKAKKIAIREEKKIESDKIKFEEKHSIYANDNPWYYKDEIFSSHHFDESCFGFIYIIEEISTGKIYVGQKQLWTSKTKTVNKKKKKIKVENDWRDYYSSSAYINEKVNSEGNKDFKRNVLFLIGSNGMLNWVEMILQVDLRMLENQEKYINGFVGGRIATLHVKPEKIIDCDKNLLNKIYLNTTTGFFK